jgi:hypothetical protein
MDLVTMSVQEENPPEPDIDDLWDIWRSGPLPAPRSLRETFEILSLYDPAKGLDALLDRIDFRGVPAAHSHEVVLNRPPEDIAVMRSAKAAEPHKRFKQALLSREFQEKLVRLMLLAYPEKTRVVLLHIPKCAGTNLAIHLIPRYLPLARAMEAEDWTSKAKMLEWIGGLTRAAAMFDAFFVYGHTLFGDYVRRVGTRMQDQIFTVLRDPLDLMVSQANYNVSLMQRDPAASRPDTREAMRLLGLDSIPAQLTPERLRALAVQALLDPKIAQPNRICTYLGDDRADLTISNLITHNIEVTDMLRYSAWLKERWGIESTSRYNASRQILAREDALPYLDTLQPRIAEDQLVYDQVKVMLDSTGQTSLRGAQLA